MSPERRPLRGKHGSPLERSEPSDAGECERSELTAAWRHLEQLYPVPAKGLRATFDAYRAAEELVWIQEEPDNMGAWSFVHERLHALLRDDYRLAHVARAEAGSPAAGSSTFHELEELDLIQRAFGPLPN